MSEMISVCGTKCDECYCYKASMCRGCNFHKGKVFHFPKDKDCNIYHCVKKNNYDSCLGCGKLPCEIWNNTRDPKFSDEEFQKNIEERIKVLETYFQVVSK